MGDAMSGDVPMISLPTDSTRIDMPQPRAAAAPEPAKKGTELRKAAVPAAAPKPAADPRSASDRKPAVPPAAAPKPPVQVAKPAPPPPAPKAAPAEPAAEEDPEKLLREYTDRQKTKITRLEAQLV